MRSAIFLAHFLYEFQFNILLDSDIDFIPLKSYTSTSDAPIVIPVLVLVLFCQHLICIGKAINA